jgi:uncharacterized protein
MFRSGFSIVAVVGALVVFIFLAKYSISTRVVPSLGEYIASTTASTTKSDEEGTTATSTMLSTPVPSVMTTTAVPKETTVTLKAPKNSIQIIVASTSEASARGLGGRTSLPPDWGMLFPFGTPGMYGFWMKDMHISIDMIWIGADKKVLGVTSAVSPATYPTIFYPPDPISYVLELNSGKAKAFGIATGTLLVF